MRKTMRNSLMSLLFSAVIAFNAMPASVFASEPDQMPSETVCTDEVCTHDHLEAAQLEGSGEDAVPISENIDGTGVSVPMENVEVVPITPEEPIVPNIPEEPNISDTPEESILPESPSDSTAEHPQEESVPLIWELESDGTLYITGNGYVPRFSSADQQPWKDVRSQITGVSFDTSASLVIEDIAYWFSGCTNLAYAEIPEYVQVIGYHAFYDCQALHNLYLFHTSNIPSLEIGAFITNHPLNWELDYDPRLQISLVPNIGDSLMTLACNYDWGSDNCPVHIQIGSEATLFNTTTTFATRAAGSCNNCGRTCAYTVEYVPWNSTEHCIRHWCSNCGLDQCGGVNAGRHTMYNGRCTLCGYSDGSGGGGGGGCNHLRTYKNWTGTCTWDKYCSDCGRYLGSGTTHGSYSYGPWEYYTSSQHRSYYSCNDCGEGSYEYRYHSTQRKYAQYSSTQHSYRDYCSTCNSNIGSATYEGHNFQYGIWESYSSTQHRRAKICPVCGYSTYEYKSHNLTYRNWENYSDTQHRRFYSCSCGYKGYEYVNHSYSIGGWSSLSDTQHRRIKTCTCGRSITETGNHRDLNNDGFCDDCNYAMTRFSVTVPADLSLVMSEGGQIHAADTAAIVNNSTDTVAVKGMKYQAENGWQIVPYATDMANEKVDSKKIGFRINDAESAEAGNLSVLNTVGSQWQILKDDSLLLTYDAVVSATTQPVNEQVLTVIFILDWAA